MSAFGKSAPVPTLGESYNMGFERGQVLERERIIKVLEQVMCSCTLAECQVAKTIALIKGEK